MVKSEIVMKIDVLWLFCRGHIDMTVQASPTPTYLVQQCCKIYNEVLGRFSWDYRKLLYVPVYQLWAKTLHPPSPPTPPARSPDPFWRLLVSRIVLLLLHSLLCPKYWVGGKKTDFQNWSGRIARGETKWNVLECCWYIVCSYVYTVIYIRLLPSADVSCDTYSSNTRRQ